MGFELILVRDCFSFLERLLLLAHPLVSSLCFGIELGFVLAKQST